MTERNTTGIERRGDGFVIVHYDNDGIKSELVLSEAAMLTLAPAFPRLLREQLALKQTPQMAQQGIEPVIRALVVRARIVPDLHGTEVMVHFQDELGNWTAYGLPPDLAKQIGERLIAHADEAKKLAADRPRQ
jgi:hypothetical protein